MRLRQPADEQNFENLKFDAVTELEDEVKSIEATITASDLPQDQKDKLLYELNSALPASIKGITDAQDSDEVAQHDTEGKKNLNEVAQHVSNAIEFNDKLNEAKTNAHKSS